MERIKNWARKIRDHQVINKEIQEHDSFETPEDRFRNFLTKEKSIKDTIRVTKVIDRLIAKKDKTVVKQIIDKSLDKIDINFEIKLEAQFEKDYPGRKAIWKGNPTGLFKKWLIEHSLHEDYFNKPKRDFEPTGSLTLS